MIIPDNWLILTGGGLISGLVAGLLGIGGGTILVPLLVSLGYIPVKAVATSSLAIVLTSFFGSLQNWRMGYLKFRQVFALGIPAVISAPLGAYLANLIPDYLLLFSFALLLLFNIYLGSLNRNLQLQQTLGEQSGFNEPKVQHNASYYMVSRLAIGTGAGLLAGLFGVGGGVIMVPLQILLLQEKIKTAIQTSLGVIVITSIAACAKHASVGNVVWLQGILLGLGGLVGAQITTRYLPKLPDRVVVICFYTMLAILSIYILIKAWFAYQ